jgi:hypothetical protein
MTNIKNLLGDIAAKLKEKMGIDPSDLQQMQKAEEESTQRMALVEDRLAALRDEIKRAEARILHRKREFDQETGGAKRMLGRELDRMVRRLTPLEREHEIQLDNQDATHAIISKVRELRAILSGRIKEEEIDLVAVQLEDAIEAADSAEQALNSLRQLSVRTSQSSPAAEEPRQAAPAVAEPAPGLTEETAAFLRQLESDHA